MQRALPVIAGLIWAVSVIYVGQQVLVPLGLIQPALMGSLFAPGLILAAMIGRTMIGHKSEASRAIDQAVVQNTLRQIVLGLCIWPLVGFFLGVGLVLCLGAGLAFARLIYWFGAHRSPALALFGTTATFAPTLFVAVMAVSRLAFGN